jgi:hypothetical protein
MNARATELQAAENNLKQLMAEVTSGHGQGSGSHCKNSPQERDQHSSDGIHAFIG